MERGDISRMSEFILDILIRENFGKCQGLIHT
jgi:hypothetical protein